MYTVLLVLHVIVAVLMMASILVQSGKGGGLAAGLGGASATTDVFGSVGAQSFLVKATIVLGALFIGISLVLALLASSTDSAMDISSGPQQQGTKAEPVVSEGSSDNQSGENTETDNASGDKNTASDSAMAPGSDSDSTSGNKKGTAGEMDKDDNAPEKDNSASEDQQNNETETSSENQDSE